MRPCRTLAVGQLARAHHALKDIGGRARGGLLLARAEKEDDVGVAKQDGRAGVPRELHVGLLRREVLLGGVHCHLYGQSCELGPLGLVLISDGERKQLGKCHGR